MCDDDLPLVIHLSNILISPNQRWQRYGKPTGDYFSSPPILMIYNKVHAHGWDFPSSET